MRTAITVISLLVVSVRAWVAPFIDDRSIAHQRSSFQTKLYSSYEVFLTSDAVLVQFLQINQQQQQPFSVYLPHNVMKQMLLDSIPLEDSSLPWELPEQVIHTIITEALHPVSQPSTESEAKTEIVSSGSYAMKFPRIRRGSDLLGSAPDPDFFRQSRRIDPYREDLTKIGHGAEYEIPKDGAYLMANDVWGRTTPADFWGSTPTQHHKSPFVNHKPIDSNFLKPSAIDERDDSNSLLNQPVTNEQLSSSPAMQEPNDSEMFHFRLPADIIEILKGVQGSQGCRMSTFQVAFPRHLVIQTLAEAVTAMKDDKKDEQSTLHNDHYSDYDSRVDWSQGYFESQERSVINANRDIAAYHQREDVIKQDTVQMTQARSDALDESLMTDLEKDTFMSNMEMREHERVFAEQQHSVSIVPDERLPAENFARDGSDEGIIETADNRLSEEAIQRIRAEIDTALEKHREDLMEEVRLVEKHAILEIQEVKEQIELLSHRIASFSETASGQGQGEATLDVRITVSADPEPNEEPNLDEINGALVAKRSFVQDVAAAKKAQAQAPFSETVEESTKVDTNAMQSVAESYVSNLMQCVKGRPIFQGATASAIKEIEREIQAAIKSERNETSRVALHTAATAVTNILDPTEKQRPKRFFET